MNDEDLLGYFDIHSRTGRALFHKDHVERLMCLAGRAPTDTERWPSFIAVHADVADPLVERAQAHEVSCNQRRQRMKSDAERLTVGRVEAAKLLIELGAVIRGVTRTPEYDSLQLEYTRLMDRLASDPAVRPHLAPWMLDFNGRQPLQRSKILAWLEARLANVTDSGSGIESGTARWHLGALCTDTAAKDLCKAAHAELREHLESGALSLSLHFWGWNFEKIRDAESAREFLSRQTS